MSRSLVLPEVSPQAAQPGGLPVPQHYELALAFDTDNAEFVRGFEAARVWQQVRDTEDTVTATVHADNAEMMMRIGEATGRVVASQDIDDMWISVTFHPYQGDPA